MEQEQAIWIKDPLAILADGAERGVVVQNGRIVELVPAGGNPATADTAVYEAGAHVVLPGLINTHHHFYQTLTRALPAALDRELFPWLQALYPVWARLTPEALDLGVTVAMSELLLSGCTTTTDHHYVFPAGLEDAVDIEVAVAKRLGVRVLLTRGSMNRSQRDGGLPPDSVVQDEDTILADSERVVIKHHQRGDDAMVQIALAPCSPFSVTTSLMRATATLANRLDVRLHTHLGETEDENRYCEEIYRCRPLDYLEQCGWLSGRTWLARTAPLHRIRHDQSLRSVSSGAALMSSAPAVPGAGRCRAGLFTCSATMDAVFPTASCSKRNANFASYAAAIVALASAGRSHTARLNGPIAFLRVL
jgi:8-oxoguanine deaminase